MNCVQADSSCVSDIEVDTCSEAMLTTSTPQTTFSSINQQTMPLNALPSHLVNVDTADDHRDSSNSSPVSSSTNYRHPESICEVTFTTNGHTTFEGDSIASNQFTRNNARIIQLNGGHNVHNNVAETQEPNTMMLKLLRMSMEERTNHLKEEKLNGDDKGHGGTVSSAAQSILSTLTSVAPSSSSTPPTNMSPPTEVEHTTMHPDDEDSSQSICYTRSSEAMSHGGNVSLLSVENEEATLGSVLSERQQRSSTANENGGNQKSSVQDLEHLQTALRKLIKEVSQQNHQSGPNQELQPKECHLRNGMLDGRMSLQFKEEDRNGRSTPQSSINSEDKRSEAQQNRINKAVNLMLPYNRHLARKKVLMASSAMSRQKFGTTVYGLGNRAAGVIKSRPAAVPTASRSSVSGPKSIALTLAQTTPSNLPELYTPYPAKLRSGIEIKMAVQPEEQHRARYLTEGSRGAVKDRTGNAFPVVRLTGTTQGGRLQVFIGSDQGRPVPHMFYQASKVCGKNSTPCDELRIDGTTVIQMTIPPVAQEALTEDNASNRELVCDCVGILKERNVDVEKRLSRYGNLLPVSAFNENCNTSNKKRSTRCRLVFRLILDSGETIQTSSAAILCTQPPGAPEICKKSMKEAPCDGGSPESELFIIGKNFLKDTKVLFREVSDGTVKWETTVVPEKEYLQTSHLVCKVPPYRSRDITSPVFIELIVSSGGRSSDASGFTYVPLQRSAHQTEPITPVVTESAATTPSPGPCNNSPKLATPTTILQFPVIQAQNAAAANLSASTGNIQFVVVQPSNSQQVLNLLTTSDISQVASQPATISVSSSPQTNDVLVAKREQMEISHGVTPPATAIITTINSLNAVPNEQKFVTQEQQAHATISATNVATQQNQVQPCLVQQVLPQAIFTPVTAQASPNASNLPSSVTPPHSDNSHILSNLDNGIKRKISVDDIKPQVSGIIVETVSAPAISNAITNTANNITMSQSVNQTWTETVQSAVNNTEAKTTEQIVNVVPLPDTNGLHKHASLQPQVPAVQSQVTMSQTGTSHAVWNDTKQPMSAKDHAAIQHIATSLAASAQQVEESCEDPHIKKQKVTQPAQQQQQQGEAMIHSGLLCNNQQTIIHQSTPSPMVHQSTQSALNHQQSQSPMIHQSAQPIVLQAQQTSSTSTTCPAVPPATLSIANIQQTNASPAANSPAQNEGSSSSGQSFSSQFVTPSSQSQSSGSHQPPAATFSSAEAAGQQLLTARSVDSSRPILMEVENTTISTNSIICSSEQQKQQQQQHVVSQQTNNQFMISTNSTAAQQATQNPTMVQGFAQQFHNTPASNINASNNCNSPVQQQQNLNFTNATQSHEQRPNDLFNVFTQVSTQPQSQVFVSQNINNVSSQINTVTPMDCQTIEPVANQGQQQQADQVIPMNVDQPPASNSPLSQQSSQQQPPAQTQQQIIQQQSPVQQQLLQQQQQHSPAQQLLQQQQQQHSPAQQLLQQQQQSPSQQVPQQLLQQQHSPAQQVQQQILQQQQQSSAQQVPQQLLQQQQSPSQQVQQQLLQHPSAQQVQQQILQQQSPAQQVQQQMLQQQQQHAPAQQVQQQMLQQTASPHMLQQQQSSPAQQVQQQLLQQQQQHSPAQVQQQLLQQQQQQQSPAQQQLIQQHQQPSSAQQVQQQMLQQQLQQNHNKPAFVFVSTPNGLSGTSTPKSSQPPTASDADPQIFNNGFNVSHLHDILKLQQQQQQQQLCAANNQQNLNELNNVANTITLTAQQSQQQAQQQITFSPAGTHMHNTHLATNNYLSSSSAATAMQVVNNKDHGRSVAEVPLSISLPFGSDQMSQHQRSTDERETNISLANQLIQASTNEIVFNSRNNDSSSLAHNNSNNNNNNNNNNGHSNNSNNSASEKNETSHSGLVRQSLMTHQASVLQQNAANQCSSNQQTAVVNEILQMQQQQEATAMQMEANIHNGMPSLTQNSHTNMNGNNANQAGQTHTVHHQNNSSISVAVVTGVNGDVNAFHPSVDCQLSSMSMLAESDLLSMINPEDFVERQTVGANVANVVAGKTQ